MRKCAILVCQLLVGSSRQEQFAARRREIEHSIRDGARECEEDLKRCRDMVNGVWGPSSYEPYPEKPADYLCTGFANELQQFMHEDQDTLDTLNRKIIAIDEKRDEIEQKVHECRTKNEILAEQTATQEKGASETAQGTQTGTTVTEEEEASATETQTDKQHDVNQPKPEAPSIENESSGVEEKSPQSEITDLQDQDDKSNPSSQAEDTCEGQSSREEEQGTCGRIDSEQNPALAMISGQVYCEAQVQRLNLLDVVQQISSENYFKIYQSVLTKERKNVDDYALQWQVYNAKRASEREEAIQQYESEIIKLIGKEKECKLSCDFEVQTKRENIKKLEDQIFETKRRAQELEEEIRILKQSVSS